MSETKTISIFSQKGGVGKSTTAVNLGVALAKRGHGVLIVDSDPQASATAMLGYREADALPCTLSTLMERQIADKPLFVREAVIRSDEGVDLIPSNIELSAMEMRLLSVMSRETVMRECLAPLKDNYDYVLIDCMPSLSMIPINALAASDSVMIPVQPQYLSVKGLDQLLSTVSMVKKQINPRLSIEGILLTMTDMRTNLARQIKRMVYDQYGGRIGIFGSEVPLAVKAAEASAAGKSVFAYDPGGKVAEAYANLAKEVVERGERTRHRTSDERSR